MTPKQERFVAEYLVDLNATQAAIRAGYSKRTARKQGARLLTYADIAQAVRKAKGEQLTEVKVTAQRVLDEIAALAFADLRELYDERGRLKPVHQWPDRAAKAVAGVETLKRNITAGDGEQEQVYKVRTWDKPKNLELLAKHFALLTEKVEHSGDVTFRWRSTEDE